MGKLQTLQLIVPDLLDAMKRVFKGYPGSYPLLVNLISRVNQAYPSDIARASYMVAQIRFNRGANKQREIEWISDFLKEAS